jgi:hypothetical protein
MAEFSKYFSKRIIFIMIISIVIFLGLYYYGNSKTYVMDRMTNNDGSTKGTMNPTNTNIETPKVIPDGYNNKEVADPSSLLPKDMNSEWAKLNPVNTDKVIGSDLLDSAAFMGQVSQHKGIMNYDLRAWPVIPKQNVGPWLQSVYEPDVYQIGIKCAA